MNTLLVIGIVAVLLIYIGFKWNNFRTKIAFFFILFGVLFVLFVVFLTVSGSTFNFSSLGEAVSSMRVYFLWIKGLLVNVFETTGRVIGSGPGNSTG